MPASASDGLTQTLQILHRKINMAHAGTDTDEEKGNKSDWELFFFRVKHVNPAVIAACGELLQYFYSKQKKNPAENNNLVDHATNISEKLC